MPRRNTIEIIIKGEDRASGVLSKVGGMVSGLGKAAMIGLGAIGAAGAVAGAAMLKLAVDAAPLVGIKEAFEGIAESSGESADKMLAALQKGSAGMITQRDLMAKYNLAAQLVGTTFANELPNAMGFLSKVAAATGEDMGYMMDSLVRGVGRLSPMILDNLGIQVDLAQAYEDFAPTINKTVGELSKQEQQTALMNQVMQKLAENTAAMPEVVGTAATGFAALGTKIKDLKDGIGIGLQPVLLALLTPLNDLATKYGPRIIEWAEIAGAWLGEKIPEAIEWLGEMWEEWWPKISEGLTKAWDIVSPIFEALRAWLTGEGPEAMAGFLTTWEILKATVLAVVDVFRTEVLPPLLSIFDSLTESLAALGLDWGDVWNAIGQAIKVVAIVIGTVVLGIIGVIVGIATALARTAAHISSVLTDIAANFRLALESISRIVGGVMAIIKGIFTGDMDLIKAGWNSVLEGMAGAARSIFEGVVNFFRLTFGTILTAVGGFIDGVIGFFVNLKDRLVGHSIIQDLMDRLKSIFTSGLQAVVDLISSWRDRLVELFHGVLHRASEGVQGGLDKIKDAFSRLIGILDPVRHWLTVVRDVLVSMIGPFNEVRHWISVIMEKFNHLKSVLGNFQLPWWLSPGSPTPLETGLTGIEEALSNVQRLAARGLNFGGMPLAGAGAGPFAGGGGATTAINIVNNFGAGSVRSDEDILEIADAITQNLELRGIVPLL